MSGRRWRGARNIWGLLAALTVAACASAPVMVEPMPMPEPMPEPAPVLEPSPEAGEFASRDFAAPGAYPPQGFAGYGIVTFPSAPVAETRPRFGMFCRAYVAALTSVERLEAEGIAREAQMVTVWPVRDAATARAARAAPADAACETAVAGYDAPVAREAIRRARLADATEPAVDWSGRGPFLLAWSPGADQRRPGAPVLVADLSDVSSYALAERELRAWREEIQRDPDLWARGWSLERLRRISQRWLDRRAASLLVYVKG